MVSYKLQVRQPRVPPKVLGYIGDPRFSSESIELHRKELSESIKLHCSKNSVVRHGDPVFLVFQIFLPFLSVINYTIEQL